MESTTIKVLFLKQPLILPFLCHKLATTCQIDSSKVSNSKLKPDQYNCALFSYSIHSNENNFIYQLQEVLKYVGSSMVSLARLCLGHKIFQLHEIPTLNFQNNVQRFFGEGGRGNHTEKTCYRPVKTPRFIRAFILLYKWASLALLCGMQFSRGSISQSLNKLLIVPFYAASKFVKPRRLSLQLLRSSHTNGAQFFATPCIYKIIQLRPPEMTSSTKPTFGEIVKEYEGKYLRFPLRYP